jgi:hypothetical protein
MAAASLYVNVGAPQQRLPAAGSPPGRQGRGPLSDSRESRRDLEVRRNKPGQRRRRGRVSPPLAQHPGITWHDGALYVVMNNRDQLDSFWPDKFTQRQCRAARRADVPRRAGLRLRLAVLLLRLRLKKNLLNPEYGGDGKEVGRCASFTAAGGAYPGALGAGRHHVLQRHPVSRSSIRVARSSRSTDRGTVADASGRLQRHLPAVCAAASRPAISRCSRKGFAGKDPLMNPNDAVARADGVAQAPDGSLYIAESQKGKIWRVMYPRLEVKSKRSEHDHQTTPDRRRCCGRGRCISGRRGGLLRRAPPTRSKSPIPTPNGASC